MAEEQPHTSKTATDDGSGIIDPRERARQELSNSSLDFKWQLEEGIAVLTTGEVARILGVCRQTVCRLFDKEEIKGYRIPGSQDRRIPVEYLLKYMRKVGVPFEVFIHELLVLETFPKASSVLEDWLDSLGFGPDFRLSTKKKLDDTTLSRVQRGEFDQVIVRSEGYSAAVLGKIMNLLIKSVRTGGAMILDKDERIFQLDRGGFLTYEDTTIPPAALPAAFVEHIDFSDAMIRLREREGRQMKARGSSGTTATGSML